MARQDLGGGWVAEFRIEERDGRQLISELCVRPADSTALPTDGIDSALIRRIRVGRVKGAPSRRRVTESVQASVRDWLLDDFGRSLLLEAAGSLGPGRRRRGDAHRLALGITAWAYSWLCELGSSMPLAQTGVLLGLDDETVRDRVHDARRTGLLSGTDQGRAGGHLTSQGNRVVFQWLNKDGGRIHGQVLLRPGSPIGRMIDDVKTQFTEAGRGDWATEVQSRLLGHDRGRPSSRAKGDESDRSGRRGRSASGTTPGSTLRRKRGRQSDG